jgi:hypothetical protein
MHEDDLSAEEREALDRLARERAPRPTLEDRVVAALRREGLLRAPEPLRLPLAPAWRAGAAAAAVAVFVGGFALGGWLESRHATDVIARMHEQQTAATAAAEVQRTGSEYVRAVATLAALADTSRGESVQQGREVAINALRAAASELVRLAPEDPLAVKILQGLDRGQPTDTTTTPRRTLWF